jgi:succinate dehydrogenase / fumarate reductase iron-sulfur subunit
MLFVSAKISHLALLPAGSSGTKDAGNKYGNANGQGGFGACTNIGACEATCPKEIRLTNIARLNAEYLSASLTLDKEN